MHFLSVRGFRRAAGLSFLSLIGIVAASSAQAQSLILNSGDNVTVSSTGTSGVIGGMPVSNNTSSYSVVYGSNVQTSGTAAFALAGGSLSVLGGDDIVAGGSGPVTISSGFIGTSHGAEGLVASGSGPALVSGGIFRGDPISESIVVASGAAVQITGGYFGSASPLYVRSGGSLYLFSLNNTPFMLSGIPGTMPQTSYNNTSLSLASLSSSSYNFYGITGTLADGEPFSNRLFGAGTINFNLPVPAAVPEASTTVSLGLLLMLGFSGMVTAKRRAKAA